MVHRVLPGLLLAAVFAVLVGDFARPLSSSDTYFHLRFGHEFLNGWSLHDPGSVTSQATAHWVPTQWLPEIAMARLEDWSGLAGVAWFGGLQATALVAALWVAVRRGAEPLVAAGVVMTALVAMSIGLSVRPQVVSYALVVVTVDAWLRTAEDSRPRWWLVPMTWVWAMWHGMWPVGIALGGVALVGMALDRRTTQGRWWVLAAVPTLSAVAAALTPVGPELYAQELRVQDRASFFSEWQSPTLTNHTCVTLGVLFAVVLLALVRTGWPGWTTALLLLVAAACAVWTWRTVPVAAAIAFPAGARTLQRLIGRSSEGPRRRELLALTAGCAVTLAALAAIAPGRVTDPTRSPSWLQPAMTSLPSGTKVLSTWDTSAILMWRFPELDLVANGYGDAYTLPELRRSSDLQAVSPGWVDDLKRTGATRALLPDGSPLARAIEHQEHWRVLHRSSGIVELQAPPGWDAKLATMGQGSRSRTTASASNRP